MRNLIILTIVLIALWLGLSGLYKPLILALGAVSIVVVLILSDRFKLIDLEGVPYSRFFALCTYSVWLIGEIAKSNYRVIRGCLSAELDICPTLVKVKTTCQSDLAKTIFANSITLTPGTVTISIEGNKMLVHGLYEPECEPEAFIDMDARSKRAAGDSVIGAST